jgi:nucleoside 2-deoxyribosyltransferase
MTLTVYLAGPIFGCTDDECRAWREQAKYFLGGAIKTLDPMRRDYRGREAASAAEIVHGDLADIEQCDVVLANVSKPTWGTGMEIAHAHMLGKPAFAFGATNPASPWLLHHCHCMHADLEAACDSIVQYEADE